MYKSGFNYSLVSYKGKFMIDRSLFYNPFLSTKIMTMTKKT